MRLCEFGSLLPFSHNFPEMEIWPWPWSQGHRLKVKVTGLLCASALMEVQLCESGRVRGFFRGMTLNWPLTFRRPWQLRSRPHQLPTHQSSFQSIKSFLRNALSKYLVLLYRENLFYPRPWIDLWPWSDLDAKCQASDSTTIPSFSSIHPQLSEQHKVENFSLII